MKSIQCVLDEDALEAPHPQGAAHHQTTLAALEAGKQVLVEKAMASDTAQCDGMIDLARRKGLVLAVAYYRRAYPTILRAKALSDAGAVGELKSIYLNDEFPLSHRLDLLYFFSGDVAEIEARHEELPPCGAETEGVMLYCRHANGVVGYTPGGWEENLVPETLDIRGTKGRASLCCDGVEGRKSTVLLDLIRQLKSGDGPKTVVYA